jgi:20S proteasome subunit beta 2
MIATSTGTTIVGVKFGGGSSGEEEGVCLGADTRATGGSIVADKNCEKVSSATLPLGNKLTLRFTTSLLRSGVVVLVPQLIPSKLILPPSRYKLTCRFVTNLIASNLELHALSQGRPARVVTAMTMLKQYLFR